MSDPLAWTGAIGGAVAAAAGIIAAIGAWRTEITARWQARVETLRNDAARRENQLQRMRHTDLYQWWHDMPDGLTRVKAMHWFGEWTGARDPYHGGDQGALPPGFGCANASEAYDRYIALLGLIYHPGQPGPPPRLIKPPDVPDAITPGAGGSPGGEPAAQDQPGQKGSSTAARSISHHQRPNRHRRRLRVLGRQVLAVLQVMRPRRSVM
jgi:hypothetical protein